MIKDSKKVCSRFFIGTFLLICVLLPLEEVFAGYVQGTYYSQTTYYSQSPYYTQSTYFTESSYPTTFTTNVDTEGTSGNLSVTGAISKGLGSFVIDHPLDPENKLLYHSFVESPDVKNIYDGVVELDEGGEASVLLPSYFEALNHAYRYQIRALTEAMPNLYIKNEVEDNQFTIAGGAPGGTISWQVTGIRKDPFIIANPIVVEEEKDGSGIVEDGEFIFEGYLTESSSAGFKRFLRRIWFSFADLF